MKLEVEELQKEIENYVEQLKTVDDTIQQYEEQIQELLDKMKLTKVFIEKKKCVKQGLKIPQVRRPGLENWNFGLVVFPFKNPVGHAFNKIKTPHASFCQSFPFTVNKY